MLKVSEVPEVKGQIESLVAKLQQNVKGVHSAQKSERTEYLKFPVHILTPFSTLTPLRTNPRLCLSYITY